ncbi:hypothetical protein AB0K15_28305 [Amycolatopsis sp. NPDC049253]|uniref:hypothetical protein n=1 Tax=Amycolatopsis sp. NPDC049253 TaxID=3155274 RepID=UPI00342128F8
MGNLYDYFAASSDEQAATALQSPTVTNFPVVALKRIDPTIHLNRAEALLTATDYDTVSANPRSEHLIAELDESIWVTTLTDELPDALASAGETHRRAVAELWARSEEFDGDIDPADLLPVVDELADLARQAKAAGDRLYCRTCL